MRTEWSLEEGLTTEKNRRVDQAWPLPLFQQGQTGMPVRAPTWHRGLCIPSTPEPRQSPSALSIGVSGHQKEQHGTFWNDCLLETCPSHCSIQSITRFTFRLAFLNHESKYLLGVLYHLAGACTVILSQIPCEVPALMIPGSQSTEIRAVATLIGLCEQQGWLMVELESCHRSTVTSSEESLRHPPPSLLSPLPPHSIIQPTQQPQESCTQLLLMKLMVQRITTFKL